jgi:hypothetical protein
VPVTAVEAVVAAGVFCKPAEGVSVVCAALLHAESTMLKIIMSGNICLVRVFILISKKVLMGLVQGTRPAQSNAQVVGSKSRAYPVYLKVG